MLQRCSQECRQDAWESWHAYPSEREASAGSLLLVEFTDFYSRYGIAADERTRSAMLVGTQAAYEVRRIPCLRACVSGVGGALQRCT